MSTLPVPSPASPVAAAPLTPAHLAELHRADLYLRKLRNVQRTASTDAWLTGIFAAVTIATGFTALPSLALGLVMVFVFVNSWRGARRLRRLDVSAVTLLAKNQLLLGAAIVIYSLWCIRDAAHGGLLSTVAAADPQTATILAPYAGLEHTITLTIYMTFILATLLAQGLTALYYASRRPILQAYLTNTPPWVLDVHAAQR